MEYSEWISGDVPQMVSLPFDTMHSMLDSLPYGMQEPDTEKQAKLAETMVIICSGAMFVQNHELHKKIVRMGNVISSLLPDDSHAQSFSLGALSVMVSVANTVDQIQKNGL